MSNIEHNSIVEQIKHQFPAFYKEHGTDFIMFMEAYYEWVEQEETLEYNRELSKITDIDETYVKFLENFKSKYMFNLPPEILGNQRLLQKHILELYRSKGSDAGLKLLFRLLYNEDVEKYIPSYDIFKASDNTWVIPQYIEVTSSPLTDSYTNQFVYGATSGASATVESVESKHVNGRMVNLLFVTNVKGVFKVGERVVRNDDDIATAPIIRGSVTDLNVTVSSAGYEVGDTIIATTGDKPITAAVAEVFEGTGILEFEIVDGGSYYSEDTVITITQGANTQGSGAQIAIGKIGDPFDFLWNSDALLPFAEVPLSSTFEFAAVPEADLDTVIDTCLSYETKTVGTIESVLVHNPGSNYDASPTITAIDPFTSKSGLIIDGKQVGMDAIITGTSRYGQGLIKTVRVLSSGYAQQNQGSISFLKDDKTKAATATTVIGGVGIDIGYYDNTKSFLSDDKYLFDGHYYQDFSYVLKSAHTLDKYIDVLRAIYHPAGNAVFGDVRIVATDSLSNNTTYEPVVKSLPV